MDRDGRTGSGQAMNERGIGDPLVDRSRCARPREDAEAGARVAVAPRGRLDLELAETGYDCLDVDTPIAEALESAADRSRGQSDTRLAERSARGHDLRPCASPSSSPA